MRLKLLLLLLLLVSEASAQVTFDRLKNAASEPGSWLTYSGNYQGWRFSPLRQLTRENVKDLRLAWVHQMRNAQVETTPLVVDGVMYLTEPPNDVAALDPESGRVFWRYRRSLPTDIRACCGRVNRGLAMYGDKLYLGTTRLAPPRARLHGRGTSSGTSRSRTTNIGYAITGAPLSIKDMILTGVAGGEYGIRGFLDAYDAATGERRWRFYTVPGPGEPGNESWSGDSWKTGGAPTWVTGSYDPESNLVVWGTGNPAPDWNGDARLGDNLYSDSAIALDADTGELRWHFQFVPHDVHDWDAVQVPVLVDDDWKGRARESSCTGPTATASTMSSIARRAAFSSGPLREADLGQRARRERPAHSSSRDRSHGKRESSSGRAPSERRTGSLLPTIPRPGSSTSPRGRDRDSTSRGRTSTVPGEPFYGGRQVAILEDDPGHGVIRALDPKYGEESLGSRARGKADGRRALDRQPSRLRRKPRGLLLRSRRRFRKGALPHLPRRRRPRRHRRRRRDVRRADHVRGEGKAVRLDVLRKRSLYVRSAE